MGSGRILSRPTASHDRPLTPARASRAMAGTQGFRRRRRVHVSRGITDKLANLANDLVFATLGVPKFTSTTNVYEGRLRVQRAF